VEYGGRSYITPELGVYDVDMWGDECREVKRCVVDGFKGIL
jgi:hypothetical protein